jgi:tetratricopeptide (TPR) repeat protein
MDEPRWDSLQDAQLMIGLLEYDRAEELLRGALREADAAGDDTKASLALEALGTIATRRGREAAARDLLLEAVARGGTPDPAERTQLYFDLARVHSGLGDADAAIAVLEDALDRVGDDGDLAVRARLGIALSYACSDAGDYARTGVILADLVRSGAEDLDATTRGSINFALARLAAMTGRGAHAIAYTRRSVEVYRELGDDYGTANALLVHAYCLLDDGQTEEAARSLQESRRLFGPRPSAVDLGFQLVEEARCELQCGDWDSAQARAREAVELLGDLSVPGQLGLAYLVLARTYDEQREDDRADRAYLASIDLLLRQNGWLRELAKAYRWYGKFLRRSGRPEAAMEALEQASDLSLRARQAVGDA